MFAIISRVKSIRLLIILLSVSSASIIVQAQNLNPTETKIVSAIDADTEQPVDLLRRLVEINSGTKNAPVCRMSDRCSHSLKADMTWSSYAGFHGSSHENT